MNVPFNMDYFKRWYPGRNILGIRRGSRPTLNFFWMRQLRRLLAPGSHVLEVGCGLGFLGARVAREFHYVGLDVSAPVLSSVRLDRGIGPLICGDAQSLPFRDGTFSAIVAFDVIEHLPFPEQFFAEARRVLRDRGVLVLTTPNPQSFGARRKGTAWNGDPSHDVTHINVRKIAEWRAALAEGLFRIRRDGTDFLWDPPYFQHVPGVLQRAAFVGSQWALGWLVGFLPWRLGENYIAICERE